MKKYLIAFCCCLLSTVVNGAEKEHDHSSHENSKKQVDHAAHEHGVAKMNLAKFGKEVQIELTTPAFNLVGFENEPNSKDQELTVKRTEEILKEPSKLFIFKESSCVVEHSSITSPFDMEKHDSSEHKSHGHKSHDKDSENNSSHSEYILEYHFDCEFSSKALNIDISSLLTSFPNFSKIRVQWLSDNQQGSAEFTPKQPRLSFK